jgi:hypothetical protein
VQVDDRFQWSDNWMLMPKQTIKHPHDIYKFFKQHPPLHAAHWWYRGQGNAKWPLRPKAGRPEFYLSEQPGETGVHQDAERYNDWENHAVAYLELPAASRGYRLALAAHHGLATRLLDWTFNPLVAVYFACREVAIDDDTKANAPGGVYGCDSRQLPRLVGGPFDAANDIVKVTAPSFSPRIINQCSVFTLHRPPYSILSTEKLPCLLIPHELKQAVMDHLDDYGINHSSMFPDADGLSAYMDFKTKRYQRKHKADGTHKPPQS